MLERYIWNILLSVDQLINAIFLGSPDETISSRCGKRLRTNKKCYFCKFICKQLHKIDPNHCRDAIEEDEGNRDVKF